MNYDIAIIGGGPAGATVGTLLRKYDPSLSVAIFEREKFPREHVGESLLPMVTRVLHEMGVWDKVEAAKFPIKLGATYRWGKKSDQDLYYFHFLNNGAKFTQTERPGKYGGQRAESTFQVDRSIYDKILLDHAGELGCHVFEQAKVTEISHTADRVNALSVQLDGRTETVTARHYVDASGGESLMRRVMGVEVFSPTKLRNIAIWDYWQDAEWPENYGDGGTYVYVMSLGHGWIWFIPIGERRTSVGFVTSAEYFKNLGQSTEQVYLNAIAQEPLISKLLAKATRELQLSATKDWSFVAKRMHGENWFLAGDACGFADPILAAGLTLAQTGARRVANSIMEIERGGDAEWIKAEYDRNQHRNTLNHIRFADYWYSANEHFSDLKEYCTQIAVDSGLSLDPDSAFQWLGTGGFAEEDSGLPFAGTFTISAIKVYTSKFAASPMHWEILKNNVFELKLEGAERGTIAQYERGRVNRLDCWRRGAKTWPLNRIYKMVYNALVKEQEIQLVAERFIFEAMKEGMAVSQATAEVCLQALEGLVAEGWVAARFDESVPMLDVGS